MGKLKDIIYDKNDILVAFIIISIAALIIYSRIVIIMDYPAVLAAEADANANNVEQFYDDEDDIFDEDNGGDGGKQKDGTGNDSGNSTGGTSPTNLTEGIVLDIPQGANMNQIGQAFIDAGLAYDIDEFLDAVKTAGVETKIKAGTFNFPLEITLQQAVILVAS